MFTSTLMASALMSLGSLAEIFSVLTLVIVGSINEGMVSSIVALIVGVILIYLGNILNLVLVGVFLHRDEKFSHTYQKSKCVNVLIRVLSALTYFKFHEIVFSNLCGVRALSNKV